MKARQKRFSMIAVGLVALGAVTWLIINAMGSSMSYFYSPTEVAQGKSPTDHVFRLGGLVAQDSLDRGKELTLHFTVTDNKNSVKVDYTGILPDLFAEGQGVIAQGRMGIDGVFVAEEVLAKHDENYMPPEVADALEKAKSSSVKEAAANDS